MKLKTYLEERGLNLSAFARDLDVSPEAVRRYVHGIRIPETDVMRRIVDLTHGQVQPNDFFDLPQSGAQEGSAA